MNVLTLLASPHSDGNTDAILFATPLCVWSYADQLKPFLDRTLCLARDYLTATHRSFVDGKRAALLVACGGKEDR